VKAVPDMGLGRLQIQPGKIAPVVKIEIDGLNVDKSGLVLDGLNIRAMENPGIRQPQR
jgi:hypothetical protein